MSINIINGFKLTLILMSGIVVMSCFTGCIDVVLSLILNDWSGLHPYYKFFQVPVFFALGCLEAVILFFFFWIINIKIILNKALCFKLGLVLGGNGAGGLISHFYYLRDMEVIVILFIFSFVLVVNYYIERKS